MKTYTLRGRVNGGEKRQLITDDGRINHGMKVIEFHVWGLNNQSQAECTLNLDDDNPGTNFNASLGNQIGWAAQSGTGGVPTMYNFGLIDPNHIVIRNLVINNFGSEMANYMVIMEAVSLTDDEAIIALIKERQQDDL